MIKKQIVSVVAVVAVMGYLYLQPVKALIKPKEERAAPGKQATESPVASKINIAAVSVPAKTAIGTGLSAKITSLEEALKKAGSASEKLKLQTELAHEWDNVNQPAPAAFYYMDLAQAKNNFENWFTAGSRFNDAYKFTQDTTMQPTFVNNAILSFKKAIALRPADLESKTGLGVAYVNQTSLGITDPEGGSPMQGIMLLREVVGAEPDNWNANLNLGQFAMKSGQYQKAVERFNHMITLDTKRSKVEPYFYLAESYKQLGMKKEAIDAYVKCKEMMGDPTMGQTIDNYINELKN